MIKKDTILIVGDSWGIGEYGEPYEDRILNKTSHDGLKQYLVQNNQHVLNLSKFGGSNIESSYRCINFIANNQEYRDNIRMVIAFQTEWGRDLLDSWHIIECSNTSLENLKIQWTSRFYQRLSEFSVKYNIPVYVIGGCSDTIWLSKFQDEYPGVEIICQSFTNLLINDNHRIDTPILSNYNLHFLDKIISLKKQNVSSQDKEFLLTESKLAKQRINDWKSHPTWFAPDFMHANRYAYEKLFKHLCNRIANFLK